MGRGAAQIRGAGATAELHTGSVNYMASLEASAGSDGRAAERNRADGIAFALNFVATLAANRAGNSSAELQIVVGGVHDGVDVRLGEIALLDDDFGRVAHDKEPRFILACLADSGLRF